MTHTTLILVVAGALQLHAPVTARYLRTDAAPLFAAMHSESRRVAAPPFAFTAADVQALVRGLDAEAAAVQAARAKGRSARTPAERSLAAQGEWEDATIPIGARASGLPLERYRRTRETVHAVLQILDFQGKIDGPLEIDPASAAREMKARLARDPMAELSPASAAALKANLGSVSAAWIRYMTLVAVNG